MDGSTKGRGVPADKEEANGRRVADAYWRDADLFSTLLPGYNIKELAAEELIAEARDNFGVQVTEREAAGFTERWNELQGSVE